jgi:hypothetical protein
VISKARRSFWEASAKLPLEIQRIAQSKFKLWRAVPFHPSLQFKCIKRDLWSVRVNANYRALGLRHGEQIVWFWIGTHAEYDLLISKSFFVNQRDDVIQCA